MKIRYAVMTLMAAMTLCAGLSASAEGEAEKETGKKKEDPAKLYRELGFAAKESRVNRTPTDSDNIDFARTLLQSAKALGDSPAFQAHLLEAAFDQATRDSAGMEVAGEAVTMLKKLQPDKVTQWENREIQIYERALFRARGEDAKQAASEVFLARLLMLAKEKIDAREWDRAIFFYNLAIPLAGKPGSKASEGLRQRVEELRAKQAITKQRTRLEDEVQRAFRLAVSVPDSEARKARLQVAVKDLVDLLVMEFDDLKAAAKFAKMGGSDELKALIEAANSKVDKLDADQAQQLGDYYVELGKRAMRDSQETLAKRAHAAYKRFLDVYDKKDAKRLKVKLAFDRLDEAVKWLDPKTRPKIDIDDPKVRIQLLARERPVTIPAADKRGYTIGSVRAGSVVLIQYVSGTWSYGRSTSYYTSTYTGSPDGTTSSYNRMLLVSMDRRGNETVLATVPGGTATEPYMFVPRETHNDLVLRIADSDSDFENNSGHVQYRVKVYHNLPEPDDR